MSDAILYLPQLELRDEARTFASKDVPRQLLLNMDAEKVHYPREFIEKLAARHLPGLRFPQEVGGRGLDWQHEYFRELLANTLEGRNVEADALSGEVEGERVYG